MQKWVYLTITREGRRFTVLYDGKAVSSGRTQYYPLVVSSAILLGNERLRGQFAKPRLVGTVLSQSEIVTYQQQSADTKNKPYMESSIWSSIQDVFTVSFGCPNGIFCFSTSTPPLQDPTKSWKSAYA
jgi:hypothetical protein